MGQHSFRVDVYLGKGRVGEKKWGGGGVKKFCPNIHLLLIAIYHEFWGRRFIGTNFMQKIVKIW